MWQVSGYNGSVQLIRATVRQSGTVPLQIDFAFRELVISVLHKTNVIRPEPTLHRKQATQRSGVDIHFWHRIHNVQSTATHFDAYFGERDHGFRLNVISESGGR